ncbi:unnamed protein product [Peronospora farinosa]|uniref:Uncharacterized protein n=1 Tax=Peronospora farinosa TaxID=134698 RepID=A0AAV0T6H5_9STRA|nr:unnamed protein product [Peronospora farinosa]
MSESVEICVELFTDRTRVNEKFEASRFSSIKVISAGESSVLTISSVFRLDGTQIGRMVLIASSFEDDFVSDRLVALVEKFCDSVVTWKAQEDAVALYPVRHVQDALSAVSSSGQPPFGDSMLERVISAGRPLHTRESDDDKLDEREDEVVMYPLDEGVAGLVSDKVAVEVAKLSVTVLLAFVLSMIVADPFDPFDVVVDAVVLVVVEVPGVARSTLLA